MAVAMTAVKDEAFEMAEGRRMRQPSPSSSASAATGQIAMTLAFDPEAQAQRDPRDQRGGPGLARAHHSATAASAAASAIRLVTAPPTKSDSGRKATKAAPARAISGRAGHKPRPSPVGRKDEQQAASTETPARCMASGPACRSALRAPYG